jgi:7,8-dihydropterin-6-yl-methyl-4-(beta-D-ribofuranosyl)aminobenzene 5'-phosphate synthase
MPRGLARADRSWPARVEARLSDLGEVDEVSILPLVERLTPDGSGLAGEPGVSYLIRAGGMRVLFDSGLSGGKAESALVHNAQMLGAPLGDLDAVVISHLHLDHVGGLRAVRRRTLTFAAGALEPSGVPAHVPTRMHHPARRYRGHHSPAGDRARRGRAAAAAGDAVLAWLRHRTGAGGQCPWLWPGPDQRLRPSADRADPGGYRAGPRHPYPGRGRRAAPARPCACGTPLVPQAVLGNPHPPWQPVSERDAEHVLAEIEARGPRVIALSGHDSTPWTFDAFSRRYPYSASR